MGSGLLALVMSSAVGATGPEDRPISYQVRVLTMDGLGWRSTYYPRLDHVATQGTSTIWTADHPLVETMTKQARSCANVSNWVGQGPSTVSQVGQTSYVAKVDRLADGPKNQASAIGFLPGVACVDEGFRATVVGRKIDQGFLARVAIEESHVKVMHTVAMAESYVPGETAPTTTRPAADGSSKAILHQFYTKVQESTFGRSDPKIAVQVQIPEVSHARVEGEWLIPNNGVLLVSLGVETVADDQGKAVVLERVAVLEVEPRSRVGHPVRASFEAPRPMLAPMPRVAMPALPDRSIPQGYDPIGQAVEPAPIPIGVASADLDRIKPDPHQPSPQAIHVAPESPAPVDRVARVGFDVTQPMPIARSSSAATRALRMPPMPDRSIPTLYDADGQQIDLPPLPEALASSDLNQISPDQPSPQAVHVASDSILDPALARTSFDSSPRAEAHCALDAEEKAEGGSGLFARALSIVAAIADHLDVEVVSETDDANEAPEARAEQHAPREMTLDVRMMDKGGTRLFDSTSKLDAALKNPGKTEAVFLPIGEKFSLEIKATVVPRPAAEYKDVKKVDAPAANP